MNLWSGITPLERVVEQYGNRIGHIAIWLLLFFLWAPIVILTIMSFSADGVFTFPPTDFTLEWYNIFLQNEQAHQAIYTSIKVGVPASIIATAISMLIAYAVNRHKFLGKNYLQIIAILPLIVPLIVTGIAILLFFGLLNIQTGYITLLIAHVIRIIPFATIILIATLSSFDRALEEASMDLGADELQTFWRVTLPNLLPGIVAAGLITFTMSFNEFVYTFFVRSTGTTTLPVYIFGRIRYQITPEVNVMSIVFLAVAVGAILIAISITRIGLLTLQE